MPTEKRTEHDLVIAGQATLSEIRRQIKQLQDREKRVENYLSRLGAPKQQEVEIPKDQLQDVVYTPEFENLWIIYPSRRGVKAEKKSAFRRFQGMKKLDIKLLEKACWNYARSQTARSGYARDMVRFLKDDFWPMWIKPSEAMMNATDEKKQKRSSGSQLVEEILNDKS